VIVICLEETPPVVVGSLETKTPKQGQDLGLCECSDDGPLGRLHHEYFDKKNGLL
jgi:hypothetical protein